MKFFLVGFAALATLVSAQTGNVAFTSVPTDVTPGQPSIITYSGDPNQPVTIILRKGDPGNLETISTLTTTATGGSYSWTPDPNLEGDDYALEIRQGSSINYSGPLAVSGDGSAPTAAVSSAVSSASSAVSSAASSVSSALASSVSEVSSSASSAVSSILASVSSALNSTIPTVTSATILASGTGSIPMTRNTTMVSPTLSTATATDTTTTSGTRTGTGTATSTASGTGAPNANSGAAGLSSPLALVLGAVAAMIYLN